MGILRTFSDDGIPAAVVANRARGLRRAAIFAVLHFGTIGVCTWFVICRHNLFACAADIQVTFVAYINACIIFAFRGGMINSGHTSRFFVPLAIRTAGCQRIHRITANCARNIHIINQRRSAGDGIAGFGC